MNVKQVRTEPPDRARQRLYIQAVWIAIAGNVFLFLGKSLIAWISGSSAVFSDAANSFSDTLYSLLMGLGLLLSIRPADESHPQGHSRFEPLVSLFIAFAMASAGAAAIWQSVERFLDRTSVIQLPWTTIVLILAIGVKVGMYLFVKRIGQEARSPAIRATAHDNLTDVLTSTTALVGVWGSHVLHPIFDPIAGFVVGLWIFRATWEIIHENLGYLTGRGAPSELTHEIIQVSAKVRGVENVHRVIADYVGPQLRIDMHVNVDGAMSLDQAHDIAEKVKETVESLPDIDMVFVHVEPTHRKSDKS